MGMFRDPAEELLAEPHPHLGPTSDQVPHLPPLPCPGGMVAGADLLEEHLGEIRNLRQRLEESICINDRLREQLEHRLSCTACGNGRRGQSCPLLSRLGNFRREGP